MNGVQACGQTEEHCITAAVVRETEQGPAENGTSVASVRSNPESALGGYDGDTSEGTFYSLGFGGSIVVEMPYYISGDVTIYETTWGGYPLETAAISVWTGTEWLHVGDASNNYGSGGNSTPPL